MKAAFHYIVRVKIIIFNDKGEIDFREYDEKFENEDPILAREKAFNHYQNFIDVLLEKKNKKYLSDRQAREDLNSFIDSGTKTKVGFGEYPLELSDSLGNEIGVIMVVDEPKSNTEHSGDEFFIHGLQGGIDSYTDSAISNLQTEFDYYKYYNYQIKNKAIKVTYCNKGEWEEGYRDDEPFTYNLLETPFDWEGYEKPYWWGEPRELTKETFTKEELTKDELTVIYERLIQEGESNQIEFKTNLLYFHDKEGIKSGYRNFIRHIIAKVICSFLNSNGGVLFIGISDSGELQGLADDFSLARPPGKNQKDYFSLEADKLLREYFKGIASNIGSEFITIDGIEIFVFKVFPSKKHPIFITDLNGNKEFYVRLTTSCERYTDIEDIAKYCINKWGTL